MWYTIALFGWIICGVAVFFTLFKIEAPLGKFTNDRWGIRIGNRLGWLMMELPALFVFPLIIFLNRDSWQTTDLLVWFVVGAWVFHYFHRAMIYPLRISARPRSLPLAVVFVALFYNAVNGWFLGYYYAHIYIISPLSPLLVGRMVVGMVVFLGGMFINIYHDSLLINLRRTVASGTYVIPRGGLFERASTPNLFGEVVEWVGFAIVAWSLPAFAMALWTGANLIPRAYSVHRWYQANFSDYPSRRRAFLLAIRREG